MAGIHINKTIANWLDNDGQINYIFPDRCETNMANFNYSLFKPTSSGANMSIEGRTIGSQYDDSNNSLTTPDVDYFVKENNVILWCNVNSFDSIAFNKNKLFPVLYKNQVSQNSVNQNYLKPIYFAMFPAVNYDKKSDLVHLTFWANVQEHDDTKCLEKFAYTPFEDSTLTNYEIGNVISSDNTTITAGNYKRALFLTVGKKISAYYNANIIIDENESNAGGTVSNISQDNYYLKTMYVFEKPRIVFVPKDTVSEVVIDVGGTGSSDFQNHIHLSQQDGGMAFSTLYPATDEEVTDSGIIHIIPPELIEG